jgi:hypothetical protein
MGETYTCACTAEFGDERQLPMSAATSKTDSPEDSGSVFTRVSSHRCLLYCCYYYSTYFYIALLLPNFRLAKSRKAHPETQQILMILVPHIRPLSKVQVPRDQDSNDWVGVVDAMQSTRPILKRTHMRFTTWKFALAQNLYDGENV